MSKHHTEIEIERIMEVNSKQLDSMFSRLTLLFLNHNKNIPVQFHDQILDFQTYKMIYKKIKSAPLNLMKDVNSNGEVSVEMSDVFVLPMNSNSYLKG